MGEGGDVVLSCTCVFFFLWFAGPPGLDSTRRGRRKDLGVIRGPGVGWRGEGSRVLNAVAAMDSSAGDDGTNPIVHMNSRSSSNSLSPAAAIQFLTLIQRLKVSLNFLPTYCPHCCF